MTSTALRTDRYELTMLDAALQAGTADRPVTFEVFTRAVPTGRRFGVFGGLGRLLDELESFRFGGQEIEWLRSERVVSDAALEWLAAYRFSGDIYAYAEGELYTGGSPVMTVVGGFGESVLLETLTLSILNHDSAVAAAASLIVEAAGGRPVIEMGSRRIDAGAAVGAARAAYLGGLASSSNLEAGFRYGVPTAGTAAHAFVLLFSDEQAAFEAQFRAFGPSTTLLVDTYEMDAAIRTAVDVGGRSLAAIRIDSGDLAEGSRRARAILDDLGASQTKVIATGDLDAASIAALAPCPVDGYGAGTSVVTGEGHPTCGLIFKLVEVDGRPVAKRSPGKSTFGGRKWAWRVASRAEEVVGVSPDVQPDEGRPLQSLVVERGVRRAGPTLEASRDFHRQVVAELPRDSVLTLVRAGA